MGCGNVVLNVKIGSVARIVKLVRVLHVLNFKFSLLWETVLYLKKLQTIFSKRAYKVAHGDLTLLTGRLVNSLYLLDAVIPKMVKPEMSFFEIINTCREHLDHLKKGGIQQRARREVVHSGQISGGNSE